MKHNRYRRHTPEGFNCPQCGTPNSLVRSRVRLVERVRRMFSRKRPYRCPACLYRVWVDPRNPPGPLPTTSQRVEMR